MCILGWYAPSPTFPDCVVNFVKRAVSVLIACVLVFGAALAGCKKGGEAESSTPSEAASITSASLAHNAAAAETTDPVTSGVESSSVESPTEAEATASAATLPDNSRERQVVSSCVDSCGFAGVAYAEKNGAEAYSSGDVSGTFYHVCSVSKQFTAAAVLILNEEGKLGLDDAMSKYFPEMTCGSVTVHQLLCMSSGIPDYLTAGLYGGDIGVSEYQSAEQNRAAILGWIEAQGEMFSPGSEYYYCNTNYFLLAEIIEKVSGMPYEQFIRQRILDPLGMTSTGFGDTWDGAVVSAGGYGDPFGYKGLCRGCADMISNAVDLAKWGRELCRHELISGSVAELMTTGYIADGSSSYGYGLVVGGNDFVYHDGNISPYCSTLCVSPSRNFVLVLLDCDGGSPLFALRAAVCSEI